MAEIDATNTPEDDDGNHAKKSTKAVVAQRVTELLRIRLAGAQWQDIREFANQETAEGRVGGPWGVSDSQLKKYIQASNALLAEALEADRAELINMHLGKRMAIYARAVDTGDLRTALAALKDEAELLNLYPGKLAAKDVTAFISQLAAIVYKRLPQEQHGEFATELQTLIQTLEQK